MIKDNLGDRMKEYYENVSKTKLVRRMPVIIRLDGKAFHTFTKGLKKPFDKILMTTMKETMKYLCQNIQGCVLGYTQSDEITLVLTDYRKLTTSAWFDYEVQKMCSVAASLATLSFNRIFSKLVDEFADVYYEAWHHSETEEKYMETLYRCVSTGAIFDARCFNVPKEEVTNCVLWRQKDAERNSVNSIAQSLYNHKELQGIKMEDLVSKLETEKGVIWGNYPTDQKRGSCCIKTEEGWTIDNDIPRFINEGRDYIEKLILENNDD